MPIDLQRLNAAELRNLLANCQRLGNREMEFAVLQEMQNRGVGSRRGLAEFTWNSPKQETWPGVRMGVEKLRQSEPTVRISSGSHDLNGNAFAARNRGST